MIITSQQFNDAYKKLPYVLREYVADDDLALVTEEMGKEYQLHVDTVGALYRETTNMLLGLINPEQFVGELKSVGIPQESISAIVEELNTKVFIPLREKMQHPTEEQSSDEDADEEEASETASSNPVATTSLPNVSATVSTPIAAPAIEWVQVTPAAPVTTIPQVAATAFTPQPVAQPAMQTVRSDKTVIEAPTALVPSPAVVTQRQVPTPVLPKIHSQQTQNRDDLHAVLKTYGVDPYREPPE
jgi:hypothetical protein